MNFIVALFTDTSTELMSGAKSREWVHHNSTNQPTHQPTNKMAANDGRPKLTIRNVWTIFQCEY